MYSENHSIAAKGMRNMFIGEILLIAAVLLAWIPLVGSIALLIGSVLAFVGLYTAGAAHPGFKNAMMCVVGNFLVSMVKYVLHAKFLLVLLSIMSAILSFLVVYFVCNAAAELLTERGDIERAKSSSDVWKINLLCYGGVVVCTALRFVPVLNVITTWVAFLLSVVAGTFYLVFLKLASASLET